MDLYDMILDVVMVLAKIGYIAILVILLSYFISLDIPLVFRIIGLILMALLISFILTCVRSDITQICHESENDGFSDAPIPQLSRTTYPRTGFHGSMVLCREVISISELEEERFSNDQENVMNPDDDASYEVIELDVTDGAVSPNDQGGSVSYQDSTDMPPSYDDAVVDCANKVNAAQIAAKIFLCTFDISSNSSSSLVSPSYFTDSTQSESESSASSSAFTFSLIQRATSPSLTLSTNSTFTAFRTNAEQKLLEEEKTDQFTIVPFYQPNKVGRSLSLKQPIIVNKSDA